MKSRGRKTVYSFTVLGGGRGGECEGVGSVWWLCRGLGHEFVGRLLVVLEKIDGVCH